MPRNGRTTISRIQPAFPHPDTSWRRRMSANTMMNIQMNVNQKKNTSIDHSTVPNVQSAASIAATSYLSRTIVLTVSPKPSRLFCCHLLLVTAVLASHPLRRRKDRSSPASGDLWDVEVSLVSLIRANVAHVAGAML